MKTEVKVKTVEELKANIKLMRRDSYKARSASNALIVACSRNDTVESALEDARRMCGHDPVISQYLECGLELFNMSDHRKQARINTIRSNSLY